VKIIGQNHQFLGVNNAIASMLAIRGRTAGLRPAAVLPRLEVLDNPTRPDKKNTLRLTEPRSTVSPNGLGVFRHTQGSDEMFQIKRGFISRKQFIFTGGIWLASASQNRGPTESRCNTTLASFPDQSLAF